MFCSTQSAKIVLKNRLELTIISKILPLSGLKIVSTCDSVTRARLSHAESKFTPREGYKNIHMIILIMCNLD